MSQKLERLETTRAALERETARLGAHPPDLELLDEYARRVLGFLHPKDRRVDGSR